MNNITLACTCIPAGGPIREFEMMGSSNSVDLSSPHHISRKDVVQVAIHLRLAV